MGPRGCPHTFHDPTWANLIWTTSKFRSPMHHLHGRPWSFSHSSAWTSFASFLLQRIPRFLQSFSLPREASTLFRNPILHYKNGSWKWGIFCRLLTYFKVRSFSARSDLKNRLLASLGCFPTNFVFGRDKNHIFGRFSCIRPWRQSKEDQGCSTEANHQMQQRRVDTEWDNNLWGCFWESGLPCPSFPCLFLGKRNENTQKKKDFIKKGKRSYSTMPPEVRHDKNRQIFDVNQHQRHHEKVYCLAHIERIKHRLCLARHYSRQASNQNSLPGCLRGGGGFAFFHNK